MALTPPPPPTTSGSSAPAPKSVPGPVPIPSASTTVAGAGSKPPLTGFRSAFEHTGIPVSVLTWRPRLPSRNWSIFLTLVGTITYLYVDDRRQAKTIKAEYIDKVKALADEPLQDGTLGIVRKVKVYGARWPEDEDDDRALRYFRKYVKPYLVAAAVDYEQITAPLHGSITRQVRASVLSRRRQRLGLDPTPLPVSLPGALDPELIERREAEGGIVIVGRPSLKEYLKGLQLGWGQGVAEWDWEKEVEKGLEDVFADKSKVEVVEPVMSEPEVQPAPAITPTATAPAPSQIGLSFLTRPLSTPTAPNPLSSSSSLPAAYHVPPSPLPPHPPILLLPFTNHLGFLQLPQIIYDFFTERHRVRSGAEAAYALITDTTRPFLPPTPTSSPESTPSSLGDLDFDAETERYYKSGFKDLPDRMAKARKDYYEKLPERLEFARAFANREREMTPEEQKRGKVVTEADLIEERRKKELRWTGMEEGWDIVRPETPVAWEENWRGWLKVYDVEGDKESKA